MLTEPLFHPVSDDLFLALDEAKGDTELEAWTSRKERAQTMEVRKLTQHEVGSVFRRACVAAGVALEDTWLSGHSGRVGTAQDMAASGMSTVEIQIAGHWVNERMPKRYAEKIEAAQSGEKRFRKVEALEPDGDG